jgi:viroplasmin and RNaseH domain-containing protein
VNQQNERSATLETEMAGIMATVEHIQNQPNNLPATHTSNSNYVAWYVVLRGDRPGIYCTKEKAKERVGGHPNFKIKHFTNHRKPDGL